MINKMKISAVSVVALAIVPFMGFASVATAVEVAPADQATVAADGTQVLSNENAAANGVKVVAPQTLGTPSAPYTVSIVSVPAQARAATQVLVRGTSTGFADGNWVNAWVRDASGVQKSAGGNWVHAGKFSLPISFSSAGKYTVQLSLGAWPEEQYSQMVPINITKAAYDTKPVLFEEGHNGNRYLHVRGTANLETGKNVYVYVNRPGQLLPRLAGTATVQADGSYAFETATAATLLNKDGHYVVNVARAQSPFATIGVSVYTNKVYR